MREHMNLCRRTSCFSSRVRVGALSHDHVRVRMSRTLFTACVHAQARDCAFVLLSVAWGVRIMGTSATLFLVLALIVVDFD